MEDLRDGVGLKEAKKKLKISGPSRPRRRGWATLARKSHSRASCFFWVSEGEEGRQMEAG